MLDDNDDDQTRTTIQQKIEHRLQQSLNMQWGEESKPEDSKGLFQYVDRLMTFAVDHLIEHIVRILAPSAVVDLVRFVVWKTLDWINTVVTPNEIPFFDSQSTTVTGLSRAFVVVRIPIIQANLWL